MRRQEQLQLSRRGTRGVGMIDAMIALLILAFGMLAMSRFQARMLAQSTEAQARLAATQLADELLAMAIVDPRNPVTGATHGPCYAIPVAAGCTNAQASTIAASWAARAASAMPSGTATATWNAATSQLTVNVGWAGKAVQDGASPDPHQVNVTTDVR